MEAISIFVKVVEANSFSVAARQLRIPKTTVSAKVAGLEKRLGIRLIQRSTRKLRVTEAGKTYFRHCAIAVREVELAEAALQSTKGRPSGVLKVTAPLEIGHSVLPRIAHAFASKYPDVSLELMVTNRLVDLVDEGVDLAIRWAGALKDSSLIARRFFEAHTNLWTSPRYLEALGAPNHPRDLAKAAFVIHPLANPTVVLTNGNSDFPLKMTGRFRADAPETTRALIELGEGIAWLPDFLATDASKAGNLVPALRDWRPKEHDRGTFHFVYAGRGYALPKVESFIQTALEEMSATA